MCVHTANIKSVTLRQKTDTRHIPNTYPIITITVYSTGKKVQVIVDWNELQIQSRYI